MPCLKIAAAAVAVSIVWAAAVGYATLSGWWHTPLTPSSDPAAFLQAANAYAQSHNVGNLALVMIEDGAVFSEAFVSSSQKINRDTLFATASLSKWITALGVMHLVQTNRLDLDAPVSAYLTRWQIPASEYGSATVTVRQLLSHTSGLADGLGFGDYTETEQVPSLVESLNHPRASSGEAVRIALGRTPGSEWEYSGGGYLILQLLIEEVSGQTFADFMHTALLHPLWMSRSTYGFLGAEANVSNAYNPDGSEARHYQYAASAATGFASSAADLTRLVTSILQNSAPEVISQESLARMREPQARMFGFEIFGLGTILYSKTDSGDFFYGHDGQNEPAINSTIRINPQSRDAFIALTSGNGSLATRLGFEWVIWQGGRPDLLGVGFLAGTGIRIAYIGLGFIWIAAALLCAQSYRRRRAART